MNDATHMHAHQLKCEGCPGTGESQHVTQAAIHLDIIATLLLVNKSRHLVTSK